MHAQLVAVFDGATDLRNIREIDLWVHALGQHVQAQGHQIHVAGAFTIAEQATFDAVGPGQVAQLSSCDAFAAVIMRVQRDDQRLAVV